MLRRKEHPSASHVLCDSTWQDLRPASASGRLTFWPSFWTYVQLLHQAASESGSSASDPASGRTSIFWVRQLLNQEAQLLIQLLDQAASGRVSSFCWPLVISSANGWRQKWDTLVLVFLLQVPPAATAEHNPWAPVPPFSGAVPHWTPQMQNC